MSRNSLFSTYRQGENRVTASTLAVFQRLDIGRLERLLQIALNEDSLELVSFDNQIKSSDASGIPDGRISARFSIWIETKLRRSELDAAQLRRHLAHLSQPGQADPPFERLIALTPDVEEPPAVAAVGDDRVVWVSFTGLRSAILEILGADDDVVSEREAVLMRELLQLFDDEGLTSIPTDTVIVAARSAYPEYLEIGGYICQQGRSFRPGIEYMAFYHNRRVEPEVARIIERRDNVLMTLAEAERLGEGDGHDPAFAYLIREGLKRGGRSEGDINQIFMLEPAADSGIGHAVSHSGSVAFVMGQRYTRREDLLRARSTDDL